MQAPLLNESVELANIDLYTHAYLLGIFFFNFFQSHQEKKKKFQNVDSATYPLFMCLIFLAMWDVAKKFIFFFQIYFGITNRLERAKSFLHVFNLQFFRRVKSMSWVKTMLHEPAATNTTTTTNAFDQRWRHQNNKIY